MRQVCSRAEGTAGKAHIGKGGDEAQRHRPGDGQSPANRSDRVRTHDWPVWMSHTLYSTLRNTNKIDKSDAKMPTVVMISY
jgi:hypothetical protein